MTQSLYIGQSIRIESLAVAPHLTAFSAIALAEDRYRVMNPDLSLGVPNESAETLIRVAEQEVWSLGDVVLKRRKPRWEFDLVVYDLDRQPPTSVGIVKTALMALMDVLARHRIDVLAMPAIGMAHGGLGLADWVAAFRQALLQAPLGLHIHLSEPDAAARQALFELLKEAS